MKVFPMKTSTSGGRCQVNLTEFITISPDAMLFCTDLRDKEKRYQNARIHLKVQIQQGTKLGDYALGLNTFKAFWRENMDVPVWYKQYQNIEIPLEEGKFELDLIIPVKSMFKLRHQLQAKVKNNKVVKPIVFESFSMRYYSDYYD